MLHSPHRTSHLRAHRLPLSAPKVTPQGRADSCTMGVHGVQVNPTHTLLRDLVTKWTPLPMAGISRHTATALGELWQSAHLGAPLLVPCRSACRACHHHHMSALHPQSSMQQQQQQYHHDCTLLCGKVMLMNVCAQLMLVAHRPFGHSVKNLIGRS